MTVYWITIAAVGYLLAVARLLDPLLDQHPMGKLPTASSSRIFLAMVALILIGVAGFRWQVGSDFMAYVNNYDGHKKSFFANLESFDEPGIDALALLISHIRDDPAVFIFAASAITIGLMLWSITRYSIAIPMSILLFIFVGSWTGSFNGIRQFLATAIVLAGHRYIVDRKPLRYAIVVVLAASFHVSALAMAILYFVPSKRLRLRTIALLAASAMVALYASDAILDVVVLVKEDLTITEYVTNAINPLRVAVAVAPVALYWSRSVRTTDDDEWFYRNMAIVHATVMVAASWSAYLGRFGVYTTAFLPLVLPRLIDFPGRKLTTITRTFVVLLYAAFWYTEVSGSVALSEFHFVFGAGGSRITDGR